MDRSQTDELFTLLNQVPRFKEWLEVQRETEIKVLGLNPNADHLFRAQGRFGMVESMLAKLAQASSAPRR